MYAQRYRGYRSYDYDNDYLVSQNRIYAQHDVRTRIFTLEEAREIGEQLGVDFTVTDIEEFRRGLIMVQDYGTGHRRWNVTDDDPLIMGRIVAINLHLIPDYYTRLTLMEEEAENYWNLRRGETLR